MDAIMLAKFCIASIRRWPIFELHVADNMTRKCVTVADTVTTCTLNTFLARLRDRCLDRCMKITRNTSADGMCKLYLLAQTRAQGGSSNYIYHHTDANTFEGGWRTCGRRAGRKIVDSEGWSVPLLAADLARNRSPSHENTIPGIRKRWMTKTTRTREITNQREIIDLVHDPVKEVGCTNKLCRFV